MISNDPDSPDYLDPTIAAAYPFDQGYDLSVLSSYAELRNRPSTAAAHSSRTTSNANTVNNSAQDSLLRDSGVGGIRLTQNKSPSAATPTNTAQDEAARSSTMSHLGAASGGYSIFSNFNSVMEPEKPPAVPLRHPPGSGASKEVRKVSESKAGTKPQQVTTRSPTPRADKVNPKAVYASNACKVPELASFTADNGVNKADVTTTTDVVVKCQRRPVGLKLTVAWCGDSQVMLVRNGAVVELMDPHKPERKVGYLHIEFALFLYITILMKLHQILTNLID